MSPCGFDLGPRHPWLAVFTTVNHRFSFDSFFYCRLRMSSLSSFVFFARTRRPCRSSRLDVQQEHEERCVDEHAVNGTYFRHEERSLFLSVDLQLSGFFFFSTCFTFLLASTSFRACQTQLLHSRCVHLPCVPRGWRVHALPRLPSPLPQLHGHATQPRPRLRRPCDVRLAMASDVDVVHVHRSKCTCDRGSERKSRRGNARWNGAIHRAAQLCSVSFATARCC